MSFIRKGHQNSFGRGLQGQILDNGKIRLTFSAQFVQTGCDFTREEIEGIVSHLHNILQADKVTSFNYAPTPGNINMEDEEARA
jgi:hypothetical protein